MPPHATLFDDALRVRLAGEVARNHRAFDALLRAAARRARLGAARSAANLVRKAARAAWLHHAGVFASPRAEHLLERLGTRRVRATRDASRPRPREVRRVLHVMTEALPVGGHSRLVWRWVDADAGRTHAVALTRQRGTPVPDALRDACRGALHVLDADDRDAFHAATRLRALAGDVDLVVLHVNPDDVIAWLAFADRRGLPPIALLDHADHVFTLGARTSDLLVNLRASGAALARERRGVATARQRMLPLPVDVPPRAMSREEAKRQLGVDPSRLLLLSVASAYKYTPAGWLDFPALVEPLVAAAPHVELHLVGPASQGRWAEMEQRSGGRVRALGVRSDLGTLWQAADVYLDSFPFTSRTSWFEAAAHGTPVLGLAWRGVGADVLFADDPTFDDDLLAATGPTDYAERFRRLVADEGRRREIGGAMADAIARGHSPGAFAAALERLYAELDVTGPATPSEPADDAPCSEPVDLLLQALHRDVAPKKKRRGLFARLVTNARAT